MNSTLWSSLSCPQSASDSFARYPSSGCWGICPVSGDGTLDEESKLGRSDMDG